MPHRCRHEGGLGGGALMPPPPTRLRAALGPPRPLQQPQNTPTVTVKNTLLGCRRPLQAPAAQSAGCWRRCILGAAAVRIATKDCQQHHKTPVGCLHGWLLHDAMSIMPHATASAAHAWVAVPGGPGHARIRDAGRPSGGMVRWGVAERQCRVVLHPGSTGHVHAAVPEPACPAPRVTALG